MKKREFKYHYGTISIGSNNGTLTLNLNNKRQKKMAKWLLESNYCLKDKNDERIEPTFVKVNRFDLITKEPR